MNLIDDLFFMKLEKKHGALLISFFVLTAVCAACYVLSFYSAKLYVSLAVGIISVTACILFYYRFVFEKQRLLKLRKNIASGLSQEDTYVFDKLDGATEHDGVHLMRVRAFYPEGEGDYDRTLYFIEALPYPALENGQEFRVKTYRNIILDIEINKEINNK